MFFFVERLPSLICNPLVATLAASFSKISLLVGKKNGLMVEEVEVTGLLWKPNLLSHQLIFLEGNSKGDPREE